MLKKIIQLDFLASILGKIFEPIFLLVYLGLTVFKGKFTHIKLCYLFLIILLHGLIMSTFTGYDVNKSFQQVLLLFITILGYAQIYNKVSLEEIFSIYLKYVYWVALLGLIQYFIYCRLQINIFPYTLDMVKTQTGARLHSILLEPGSVAGFFTPAVSYIIISRIFIKKYFIKSIVIISAFLLTFTSATIVCLLLALCFRFYDRLKRFKIVFWGVLFAVVFFVLNINYKSYTFSDTDSSINKAMGKISETALTLSTVTSERINPHFFEGLNASSYAQLTNYWVAFNAPCRLLGTGIGTHAQNYEAVYVSNYVLYGLNKDDGYSLFARLLSEFGYVGLIVYFIFIYKYFNKNNLLSCCFLLFMILYMIKGGHYTLYCAALFHYLYYLCGKKTEIDESAIYL